MPHDIERRPRGASRPQADGRPADPTVCFGPVMPVTSPGTALFVRCKSVLVPPRRSREIQQTKLARNKR